MTKHEETKTFDDLMLSAEEKFWEDVSEESTLILLKDGLTYFPDKRVEILAEILYYAEMIYDDVHSEDEITQIFHELLQTDHTKWNVKIYRHMFSYLYEAPPEKVPLLLEMISECKTRFPENDLSWLAEYHYVEQTEGEKGGIKILEGRIKEHPTSYTIAYQLAQYYLKTGQFERSYKMAQQAILHQIPSDDGCTENYVLLGYKCRQALLHEKFLKGQNVGKDVHILRCRYKEILGRNSRSNILFRDEINKLLFALNFICRDDSIDNCSIEPKEAER